MIALIRQAIRELHIDIEPHNRTLGIQPILSPTDTSWHNAERTETTAYMITGTDRKGNQISIKVEADTPYPQILEALKTAWRG